MAESNPSTDVSLLARRYGPRVNEWCRAQGLQPADAEDVTQDVMLRVAQQIEPFALASASAASARGCAPSPAGR